MFLLCGFLDRFFAFKHIHRTILKSLVFCVIASLHQETSFLRARVQQVQVPLGDAARPSHLLTSQLPLMWQLYPEERYMDNNSRLWQIQHHLMVGLLLNHVFFFHFPGPLMTEYSINFSFSGRSGAYRSCCLSFCLMINRVCIFSLSPIPTLLLLFRSDRGDANDLFFSTPPGAGILGRDAPVFCSVNDNHDIHHCSAPTCGPGGGVGHGVKNCSRTQKFRKGHEEHGKWNCRGRVMQAESKPTQARS